MRLLVDTAVRVLFFALMPLLTACSSDHSLLVNKPIKLISQDLAETVPKLMEAHNVMGLSVAVLRNDQLALNQAFGFADLEKEQKINSDTIFKAASLGKPIFAFIVQSLVQQGRLDLDKPLIVYGDGAEEKIDPLYSLITARMVLSHTTGLPNFGESKRVEFQFTPGSAFQYSGHAYQYLQSVVTIITGKSINNLAQEFVFSPLEMNRSSYIWKESFRDFIAQSYNSDRKQTQVTKQVTNGFAAWSLYTTIEDYAKFVTHIMQTANSPNDISAQLLMPQVDVADDVKWGLGWGIQDTEPNQSFWHWGSLAGFRHYVVAYPKEKVAVIVMTNSSGAFKMVEEVMSQAIGGEYPSYEWF
jgi:CubicO group peptidase (beta-lactamase class C family)